MEFKGRVEKILDKSGVSKKTNEPFKAYQILVKEESGQYPQSAVFDIFGEKLQLPNIGESVTVSFSMKASEYEGKLFGKNNAWKIESERLDNTPVGSIPQPTQSAPEAAVGSAPDSGNIDLPF
jgi:hypothetical protein